MVSSDDPALVLCKVLANSTVQVNTADLAPILKCHKASVIRKINNSIKQYGYEFKNGQFVKTGEETKGNTHDSSNSNSSDGSASASASAKKAPSGRKRANPGAAKKASAVKKPKIKKEQNNESLVDDGTLEDNAEDAENYGAHICDEDL